MGPSLKNHESPKPSVPTLPHGEIDTDLSSKTYDQVLLN